MHPQIQAFTLRVVCPCYAPRSCVVPVQCLVDDSGRVLLAHSDGCEQMLGTAVCRQCPLFVSAYLSDPDHASDRFPGFYAAK